MVHASCTRSNQLKPLPAVLITAILHLIQLKEECHLNCHLSSEFKFSVNKIDCSLKHLSKQDIESQGDPYQGGPTSLVPFLTYSMKKKSHVSHSPMKTIPFFPT